MRLKRINSEQFGLALNLATGSIPPQHHVIFGDMLSTEVMNTTAYPEFSIRLVNSINNNLLVLI